LFLRRLARRGGVKRISGTIYRDTRGALKARLEEILRQVTAVVDICHRKTVTVTDVVFVLNRMGTPIYVRTSATSQPKHKQLTVGRVSSTTTSLAS
jgi:histone H3/H4